MAENKPSRDPKGGRTMGSPEEINGQTSKPKRYRGEKTRSKMTQRQKPGNNDDCKFLCSDPRGYIFDIGLRASDKFYGAMKELERYLSAAYRDTCQPTIMI